MERQSYYPEVNVLFIVLVHGNTLLWQLFRPQAVNTLVIHCFSDAVSEPFDGYEAIFAASESVRDMSLQ